MKSYFKIAWRNIWRVRNRTFITAAAIALAIFFAIIMRGFQLGSYDLMMENAVEKYIGHIQIHKTGYFSDPNINEVFADSDSVHQTVQNQENVERIISQLVGGALASFGIQSNGVIVLGIDPIAEEKRMNLEERLVSGTYLVPGDQGILIGENLAKFLKIEVGDSLTLISQGYHGVSSNGLFPVKGIVHLPAPDLNSSMVILDKSTCQYFFAAENMVSEYCVNIRNISNLEETAAALQNALGGSYEVMTWYQTRPDLKQQIDSDNASGIIFLGLLYLVIAFGVFGTIMMMTMERRKEFGITIAIGMQKSKLVRIIVLETLIIGLMGILAGILLALPINIYFHIYPIDLPGSIKEAMESFGVEAKLPFALRASFYINQTITVILILFAAIAYPAISIFRLKIIKAIRS